MPPSAANPSAGSSAAPRHGSGVEYQPGVITMGRATRPFNKSRAMDCRGRPHPKSAERRMFCDDLRFGEITRRRLDFSLN